MRHRMNHTMFVWIVSLVVSGAQGQTNTWTVREYGGDQGEDCGCYSALPGPQTIVLTDNPGVDRELKFEVYWADAGGNYVSAAPLNNFTIHANVDQALIEISILGDPEGENPLHEWGASSIARMNIRDGNFDECVLKGLKISGDLATAYDAICDSVSGNIHVGGALDKDGYSQEYTYDMLVDGSVDGEIYINELHGEILVPNGTVTGNITTGAVPGTPRTSGGVKMAGNYSATITINDGFNGQVVIE